LFFSATFAFFVVKSLLYFVCGSAALGILFLGGEFFFTLNPE